jgi:hypothetical protein
MGLEDIPASPWHPEQTAVTVSGGWAIVVVTPAPYSTRIAANMQQLR